MANWNGKVQSWHQDNGKHQRKQSNSVQESAGSQLLLSMAEGEPEDEKTLVKRLRQQLKSKSLRKSIIEDPRCKITSDRQFDDGVLHLGEKDKFEDTIHLKIEHTGTDAEYLLSYIGPRKLNYFTLKDKCNVNRKNPLPLKPGDRYEFEVTCRCSSVGCHEAMLVFEFKTPETTFHIVRVIEAKCMTALGQELAPDAPYKPLSFHGPAIQPFRAVNHGQRPGRMSQMQPKYENRLDQYEIPNDIRPQIASPTLLPQGDKDILHAPLSWNTYSRKFELLLYLEEHEMEKEMRIFSNKMSYKRMVREGNLLVLEVPGVSENRPSVLYGDELLVRPLGQKKWYGGYVHKVELDRVKLSFDQSLLDIFDEHMMFNVELPVSRLVLRIQHRAVEYASQHKFKRVLFPSAPHPSKKQPPLPDLRGLLGESLKENPEQCQAVKHIVAGSSKPAPYLVFGPPGTGKTVTLAKAIAQILETKRTCHILACAPTNSAADQLCIKILNEKNVGKSKVYRMYASSVGVNCIPTELEECCNVIPYNYPTKEELMQYRIIVTTLLTASRFVSWNFPIGHFTHMFVDEAGHALEPECIVPITGLLNPKVGQVVLAGDPEQLGPIIRSQFADKCGLGMSLIERLINSRLYQRNNGAFNELFVTKLCRNYRSHSAILKVPSELFYDDELQACAQDCNSYCNWNDLPQTGFPVIFHAVKGVDEREASSPSYFNRQEVEVLMVYVKKLLQPCDGSSSTTVEDIGIITPYRKQVEKIRKALETVGKALEMKDMKSLKVSSVEEFQGQERKVVLVSTVRSRLVYTATDKHFNVGFITNKKRFNVAMTRAKALLIVVGNPKVLKTDPNWARFIKHCKDGNSYVNGEDDE